MALVDQSQALVTPTINTLDPNKHTWTDGNRPLKRHSCSLRAFRVPLTRISTRSMAKMEVLQHLVYHHIKGDVCEKVAKKYLKAIETELDTENLPPTELAQLTQTDDSEALHQLVYHHIKTDVCEKVAKKYVKAVETDVDTENSPDTGLRQLVKQARKRAAAEETEAPAPVKRSKPNASQPQEEEEAEEADQPFQQASQRENHTLSCYNCQGEGHLARDCPAGTEQVRCYVCKKNGHMAKACPDQTCYNCQAQGHMSGACPQRQTRPCYNCQEIGHIARDCPSPSVPRPRGGRGGQGGRPQRGRGGFRKPVAREYSTGANTMALGSRKGGAADE